jgi:hypothetical protein
MARDFDFRPRRPVTPAPTRTSRKSNQWLSGVIFLGLIIIGLGFASQSSNKPTNPSSTQPSAPATAPDILKSADIVPDSPLQIYDSGSGPDAVTQAITALHGQNLEAKNLGKSQFEYDKTYVWYVAGQEALAKQVVTALGNRQVILTESKVAGNFQVLIYLGKN